MMRAEKRGASYSPPRVVWVGPRYNLFVKILRIYPCLRILSSSYIYTRQ